MKNVAIVVAAGRGTRTGRDLPKQYCLIQGAPMLTHTLRAILTSDRVDGVICAIGEGDGEHYAKVAEQIDDGRLLPPVTGGGTRGASVANALQSLKDYSPEHVLIHDAARPFVSTATIDTVLDALQSSDGAFASVAVTDAVWRMGSTLAPVDRSDLRRAQTPQGFGFKKLLRAYETNDLDQADDVAVAVSAGLNVVAVEGDERNFKVTLASDFERAEDMLRSAPDIRTGTGYDVHAFEDGQSVTLCGIKVPHDQGLRGHSDADVAMHAITDAIYGALCEGDIGQWFPPSGVEWKDAASEIFLKHAVERSKVNGFAITHLDCTIICEAPKIQPHCRAMREQLSRITGLEVGTISVKATTSEKLGFTGRKEGIAAMASATLVKP